MPPPHAIQRDGAGVWVTLRPQEFSPPGNLNDLRLNLLRINSQFLDRLRHGFERSRWRFSAEQGLKTGLFEMNIVGQGADEAAFAHQVERDAVGVQEDHGRSGTP